MRLLRPRPSALEKFLLAIFVTSVLSSFMAVYRDIQVHSRFYDSKTPDDHFSISGTPISHARLPLRLVLVASMLVTLIGVRLRKFGGRLLSILTLLLLIGLYLLWWRQSFNVMRAPENIESASEIPQTLYLIYGSWLDIGVFLASVGALGWVVVTLLTHSRESKVVPS